MPPWLELRDRPDNQICPKPEQGTFAMTPTDPLQGTELGQRGLAGAFSRLEMIKRGKHGKRTAFVSQCDGSRGSLGGRTHETTSDGAVQGQTLICPAPARNEVTEQ